MQPASRSASATTYGSGLVERMRALAPNGVDAALDIAAELIELTGEPSKVLSIADFSAPKLGAQVSSGGNTKAEALAEAAQLFTKGVLHIPVERTYPLAAAGEAQTTSAEGHVAGRLVISV